MFFPDKPELNVDDKVLAVFTAYNEAERIPFFLDYYRRLGVDHFFAIDNNSTDDTAELLAGHRDVTRFYTDQSYAASSAGRLWTTEIAEHYGRGRWVLTLDLDELFVYPCSEILPLGRLTEYLDRNHYQAVFSAFIDMYSDKPLSEAIYSRGQSFLDVAPHFDGASYELMPADNFPAMQIKGGPRQRLFWEKGGRGKGPAMRKLPLVKWSDKTNYYMSTHSLRPVPLADFTAATLHFKFFSSFKSLVDREVTRGDRSQPQDYQQYQAILNANDPLFFNEQSLRYAGSQTLVKCGYMHSSTSLERFVRANSTGAGPTIHKEVDSVREAARFAEQRAKLELHQLPALWPMMTRQFRFKLVSCEWGLVWGWAANRDGTQASVLITVDGEVAGQAQIGGPSLEDSILPREVADAVFNYRIPRKFWPSSRSARVAIVDDIDGLELGSFWLSPNGDVAQVDEYESALRSLEPDNLGGWAYAKDSSRVVEVAVFRNKRLYSVVAASRSNEELRTKLGTSRGNHGFSVRMPSSGFAVGDVLEMRVVMGSHRVKFTPVSFNGERFIHKATEERKARMAL